MGMHVTKEQFIRDFKDTLHEEQLIKVPAATAAELFTSLAKLIRKYYTDTWIERNRSLTEQQQKLPIIFRSNFYQEEC